MVEKGFITYLLCTHDTTYFGLYIVNATRKGYLWISAILLHKERPIALRSMAWREELAGHQDQRERLRRHQAKNQMLSFGDTVSTSVISVNWKESCLPTCSTKRPIPVRVIPRPPKICTASRAVSCAVCVAYIFSRAIGPARCFACSLYDCIHSLFLNIK